jgi:hypothetical protein
MLMRLRNLPPSSVAHVDYFLLQETASHSLSGSSYFRIARYVTESKSAFRNAESDLRACSINDQSSYESVVRSFDELDLNDWRAAYRSVYALYMLGSLREASKLQEAFFRNSDPAMHDAVSRSSLFFAAEGALPSLKSLLENFASTLDAEVLPSCRLKSPASVLVKLVARDSAFLREFGESLPALRLDLVYDLIGLRLVVKNASDFPLVDALLRDFWVRAGLPLQDQGVFTAPWMNRKSYVSRIECSGIEVPFQIHLWDTSAKRFERLCYGNRKMTKILWPLVACWDDLIRTDITDWQYASLVLDSYRGGGSVVSGHIPDY